MRGGRGRFEKIGNYQGANARIARSQDRKIPGTLFGQPCDPAEMTYPGGGGGTQDRKIARLPGNSLGNLAIRAESAVPGCKGQIVRSQDRKTSGKLLSNLTIRGGRGQIARWLQESHGDLAILRSCDPDQQWVSPGPFAPKACNANPAIRSMPPGSQDRSKSSTEILRSCDLAIRALVSTCNLRKLGQPVLPQLAQDWL